MASRAITAEVVAAIRFLMSSVPPLSASPEHRSDFYLLKAEVFELLAACEPPIAAQAWQVADGARREAHTIAMGL